MRGLWLLGLLTLCGASSAVEVTIQLVEPEAELTQHSSPITGYAIDSDPFADDWTQRFGPAANSNIESGATPVGDRFWRLSSPTNSADIMATWDVPAADSTVEVLMLSRRTGTNEMTGAVARWIGADGGYWGGLRNNAVDGRIGRLDSSGDYVESIAVANHGLASTVDVWLWFRVQVTGGNQRLKVWLDGEAEPASWLIEATDTQHGTAGLAGVWQVWFTTATAMDIAWISVGTNGDAPPEPAGEADMTATGTLGFGSSADLDAVGALQALGAASLSSSADLDATGSMDAVGSLAWTPAADLDAVGALQATGAVAWTPAADLDALGTLTATGAQAFGAAADLDALGALQALGSVTWAPSADLDATGALTATGPLTWSASADMGGLANDLVATGAMQLGAAADLNAVGSLAAVGDLSLSPAADLDAVGSLGAAGALQFTPLADLDARGALRATGPMTFTPVADLVATGQLSAAGALQLTPVADLGALGSLGAAGALTITDAAGLSGAGALSASEVLSISASALLTDPGQGEIGPIDRPGITSATLRRGITSGSVVRGITSSQ